MLPANYKQRFELNDEVHARPPEALTPPLRLTFVAMFTPWPRRESDLEPVRRLAETHGIEPPTPGASHYSRDFGAFRLKWERHTEFTRYKFIVQGAERTPFAEPAVERMPGDWLASLPGEVMVAAHAVLLPQPEQPPEIEALSGELFNGNALVGSRVAGGHGMAFTDFRIHGDGFSRFLVYSQRMTPRQSGRIIQRLLEIDTYRMMALLALPVARALTPFLSQSEQELAQIIEGMTTASERDQPALLERLIKLEAAIENRHSTNDYRFSAAAAYYELVQRRIEELREERIQGLQTFQEFMERRLAPAMNTCRAASVRQDLLSQRVARATQLLSTQIDVTRSEQNQQLLESMNRRAKLQLRLQQTVEGLSVAAITYYIVGLVGYGAKGLSALGLKINADIAMALSIPAVALFVALGVRKVRKIVTTEKG